MIKNKKRTYSKKKMMKKEKEKRKMKSCGMDLKKEVKVSWNNVLNYYLEI